MVEIFTEMLVIYVGRYEEIQMNLLKMDGNLVVQSTFQKTEISSEFSLKTQCVEQSVRQIDYIEVLHEKPLMFI